MTPRRRSSIAAPLPLRERLREVKQLCSRSRPLRQGKIATTSAHELGILCRLMASNFLEQLVAEWFEFRGYFVRRNVPVGRRARGGWDCELDVVAFHPEQRHLVHIEPSTDSLSWEKREIRYRRKFEAGRTQFAGLNPPEEIEQLAVFASGSTKTRAIIGGGRIVPVGKLLAEFLGDLQKRPFASQAVPESFPLLRTLQLVARHRNEL